MVQGTITIPGMAVSTTTIITPMVFQFAITLGMAGVLDSDSVRHMAGMDTPIGAVDTTIGALRITGHPIIVADIIAGLLIQYTMGEEVLAITTGLEPGQQHVNLQGPPHDRQEGLQHGHLPNLQGDLRHSLRHGLPPNQQGDLRHSLDIGRHHLIPDLLPGLHSRLGGLLQGLLQGLQRDLRAQWVHEDREGIKITVSKKNNEVSYYEDYALLSINY